MSSPETPVALVGTIAPTFQSNWWEHRRGSKGVAVIGTAVLISAAVMNTEGQWRQSYLHFEVQVQRLAELGVARMMGQQDHMLAVGMHKIAPAKELGAQVLERHLADDDPQSRWLVLADRSQAMHLPWLRGEQACEPSGLLAWPAKDTALEQTLIQLATELGDAAYVVEQLASDELAGDIGTLQSLSVWAYAGGYEWGSLVVGRPGADPQAMRAVLVNTATELGITIYHCSNAIDLDAKQTPSWDWQEIPASWVRLN
jgi:hypothetical protein